MLPLQQQFGRFGPYVSYSIISDEDDQIDMEEMFQGISDELENYQEIQFITRISTYLIRSATMDINTHRINQIRGLLPNISLQLRNQINQVMVTTIFPTLMHEFKQGLLSVYESAFSRPADTDRQYRTSEDGQSRYILAPGPDRRYDQLVPENELLRQISMTIPSDTNVILLRRIFALWTERLVLHPRNINIDADLNQLLDLVHSYTMISSSPTNPMRRFLESWSYRINTLYMLLRILCL